MASYKRLYYLDRCKKGEKCSGGGIVKLVPWNGLRNESGTSLWVELAGDLQKGNILGEVLLRFGKCYRKWGCVELVNGKGRTRLPDLEQEMERLVEEATNQKEPDPSGEIVLQLLIDSELYLECSLQEYIKQESKDEELEAAEMYPEERARVEPVCDRMRMKRDKWQQLWEVFPHMHPFDDEREYLRLELQDMIFLPQMYYRLVENSFLLHGYHNYDHLILTKLVIRGQEKICVGVPGNYYEKEKQVAVMFGFESFETKTEPAKEGDFGYYMIGVVI